MDKTSELNFLPPKKWHQCLILPKKKKVSWVKNEILNNVIQSNITP